MTSFSVPSPKSSALVSKVSQKQNLQQQSSNVSLFSSSKTKSSLSARSLLDQPLFPRFQGHSRNQSTVLKAQVNEVAIEKPQTKLEVPSSDGKDIEPAKELEAQAAVSDLSITAFMSEVANLVKLVDSRDIMELQLKQTDCELIIRKKEALPQPPAPGVMMQSPTPQAMYSSQPPSAPAAPSQASHPASSASSPTPALPASVGSSKSAHPPLKCPMAGTFYRCPAPGEPPFVKVGDKVQKGQVICIIEAMKLMNEIEADQSGIIKEILAEDGKPVSVDTPLLVIAA